MAFVIACRKYLSGQSWKSLQELQCYLGANTLIHVKSSSLSTVVLKKPSNVFTSCRREVFETAFQPVHLYSTRTHRIFQREKPKDLYSVLEITPSATQQQVKDAYYKLSMKYHPDRNKGSPEAHRKFTDLTEAYSILGQHDLRRKYDKGLLKHYPERQHTAEQPSTSAGTKKSTHFVDKERVKFNFDEFYKAHYGDALKRQRDIKKKDKEDRIRATYYSITEPVQQLLIIVVTLAVLGVGLYIFQQHREKLR